MPFCLCVNPGVLFPGNLVALPMLTLVPRRKLANKFRTHLTLDMNTPDGRLRQWRSSPDAAIETVGLFHGFWNYYRWRDVAVVC